MTQTSKAGKLVKKAEAALLAAIEIYNKPDFKYREETFAILALNAWELLLKAKLLSELRNDPRVLFVYGKQQTKSGSQSKKSYLRRNRSGNPQTIGLGRVLVDLESKASTQVPGAVKNNLNALIEIRDNAVHYINASPRLSKQVLEIGTASVKNFIELSQNWFGHDMSRYSLYLMPIGFISGAGTATAVAASRDEGKLLRFITGLIKDGETNSGKDFHVALEVNLSFKRSPTDAITVVAITDDPSAPKVTLSEEDVRKRYPWDYAELRKRLRNRYMDFKENMKFHDIRRPLAADPKYVKSRYLDPGNPKSAKKDFYNPNIVAEFDKHYTKKR